jgi:hypothetical protein
MRYIFSDLRPVKPPGNVYVQPVQSFNRQAKAFDESKSRLSVGAIGYFAGPGRCNPSELSTPPPRRYRPRPSGNAAPAQHSVGLPMEAQALGDGRPT